ncbi:unnamed protein product [Symbiodinium sp. CCMP2592]|nr:unnamed protein product [Symbiodinium sp. CCMP2592]
MCVCVWKRYKPTCWQALLIVDSSGDEDEPPVEEIQDSEPEPEKWPEPEKLPDDAFVNLKDRERLLPEGSYMKLDEHAVDDLLGDEPLDLGDLRAEQWNLRAVSKQDKAIAVLKRAAKKTKAVHAHEAKKHAKAGNHADAEQDDGMAQDSDAQDDGMAQECAQDDGMAQECAQDDGMAQECAQNDGVAQGCAQDDGVAQGCAQDDVAKDDGVAQASQDDGVAQDDQVDDPVSHGIRRASELEKACLLDPMAHQVAVPDTPLKTPDRVPDDELTPSTRKVLRNTSSYKAVSSPVPFLSDMAMNDMLVGGMHQDVDMGTGAASAAEGQMVLPRVLFAEQSAGSTDEVVPAEVDPELLHDNPYSREAAKRAKEPSTAAIPTPQKPDSKKARLEEQRRIRHERAQESWDNVVFPLRDDVPDAMPSSVDRNGQLSYTISRPADVPFMPEMPKDGPKGIQVILNARTFYVSLSVFHDEFEIEASLSARQLDLQV